MNHEKHLVVILAFLTGIIGLIRPVNMIILLILPFLAQDISNLKSGMYFILKNRWTSVLSLILFLSVISIQLIIYKISTGNFLVFSYKNEGFIFTDPHFIDILFSYKKGLFLYTPIFLLSLAGLCFLWKSNKFGFYTVAIFLLVITYVFSSWNNWWYGGSFSSRVYTEFIGLFAVLLGIAVEQARSAIIRKTVLSLALLFVILYQVQIYQYRYYYIHWENMTKEQYWDVFLRIDKLID